MVCELLSERVAVEVAVSVMLADEVAVLLLVSVAVALEVAVMLPVVLALTPFVSDDVAVFDFDGVRELVRDCVAVAVAVTLADTPNVKDAVADWEDVSLLVGVDEPVSVKLGVELAVHDEDAETPLVSEAVGVSLPEFVFDGVSLGDSLGAGVSLEVAEGELAPCSILSSGAGGDS